MLPPSLPPFLRPASPNHTRSKGTVTVFPTRLLEVVESEQFFPVSPKPSTGRAKADPWGVLAGSGQRGWDGIN